MNNHQHSPRGWRTVALPIPSETHHFPQCQRPLAPFHPPSQNGYRPASRPDRNARARQQERCKVSCCATHEAAEGGDNLAIRRQQELNSAKPQSRLSNHRQCVNDDDTRPIRHPLKKSIKHPHKGVVTLSQLQGLSGRQEPCLAASNPPSIPEMAERPQSQTKESAASLHVRSNGQFAPTTTGPTRNLSTTPVLRTTMPTTTVTTNPADTNPRRYPRIPDPVDARQNVPQWLVWLQRLFFFAVVLGLNTACAVAAFETKRHAWVLVILVFIKSKDMLSTLACMYSTIRQPGQKLSEKEVEESKWILSLICAYKETEEQIMKTVKSLLDQELSPHKQVICVIMDGTNQPLKSHFSGVSHTMHRPYVTWQAKRGELALYAGWIEEVPMILIEKRLNGGKKDSLILGHRLFNCRSDSAHIYTSLLRDEIFTTILPSITTQLCFGTFDYIFCTDADSTVHPNAIRNLARALGVNTSAVAACGVLFAELAGPEVEWTTWHLFQQWQYNFGQFVRRRAESVWGRVTCLPGCIVMIAVRPEFVAALEKYASPVTNRSLLPHQVQYLGTDRRLTWCMLVQGTDLHTILVPDAVSETVVPQTLDHYLSQRRRWASNAYFNDIYYAFGPKQFIITRLFALINIVRMTLVLYRVLNTALFVRYLINNFYIIRIVPLLVVTKTPVVWFVVHTIFTQPLLRTKLHKLAVGACIDQVISPFLSVIVFLNVVFHMGSPVWGKTGISTEVAPMVGPPLRSVFSQDWTTDRVNSLVRDVVHRRRQSDQVRQRPHPTRRSI